MQLKGLRERCELSPAENVFYSILAHHKPHLVTLNFVFFFIILSRLDSRALAPHCGVCEVSIYAFAAALRRRAVLDRTSKSYTRLSLDERCTTAAAAAAAAAVVRASVFFARVRCMLCRRGDDALYWQEGAQQLTPRTVTAPYRRLLLDHGGGHLHRRRRRLIKGVNWPVLMF